MNEPLILAALSLCFGLSEPSPQPDLPSQDATVVASDAPSDAAPSDAEARPLRIALNEDLPTLDPHHHLSIVGFAVLDNIFEALICRDRENDIVPCLATHWTHSDFRRWTFFLRPDARFHHGAAAGVDDVVFSLERARKSPASLVSSFLVSLDTVTADAEAGSVTLELGRPDPFFLESLSHIAIVPKDAPAEITEPSGTGAYRFVERRDGELIRLRRFEHGASPLPTETEIEMLVVPDAAKAVARLETGEVDLVYALPPALVDRVEADPKLWVESRLGNGILYLNLNPGFAPLADPRIRRAVDLGLDRQALVRDIGLNHSRAADQMLHPGLFGYTPELEPVTRDVEEARRLVAETGLETPIRLEIQTTDSQRSYGDAIAKQLAEIGFRVDVLIRPWPELYPDFAAGKVGAWLGMWVFDGSDGALYFGTVAHRRTADGRWGASDTMAPEVVRDEGFETDIRAAFAEPDLQKRRRAIQDLSRRSTAMRLQVPLVWPLDLYGTRRDFKWQARKDNALLVREMQRRPSDAARASDKPTD